MSEISQNYTTYIDKIDVKWDKKKDGYQENLVKDKARNYIENRIKEWMSQQELNQLLEKVKQLLERQNGEKTDFITEIKQETLQETRDNVDKEVLIQEVKTMLYEKLWIHEQLNKNSSLENFLKWIVDELVLGNYELAIEIRNTKWQVVLESLKALASWEWLKKMAVGLWESVWDLFDGNAYQKWKSAAQLWLIGTWVGVWVMVGKKAVKMWVKEFSKFRVNKESLVIQPETKNVIQQTTQRVETVLPKKQLNFDTMLVQDIAKLGTKERLEAAQTFLKRELSKSEQDAILKAHNIWDASSWIYRYSFAEKSQKLKILQEAGLSKQERKILLEKWVCGKEALESLPNGTKKIDRQHLVEDIPREDILLKEVKDFPEVPPEQAWKIDTKLVDVINTVPYNSFEKLDKLLQEFERLKSFNPQTTLQDAFQKMDFMKLNRAEWSNCVWMSYLLKEDLAKVWIESHLVRFDAGPMLNPEYVVNGHAALVIPRTINAEKHYTLADPGLLISKSITFAEWKKSAPIQINDATYMVAMDGKDSLPYVMDITDPKRTKKLYFDPSHEWLNPNTTLNKDIMRSIWDFKIVKWDKYFKTDLEKSVVTLWYEKRKIEISYADFQNMRNYEKESLVRTPTGEQMIPNRVLYNEIYAKIMAHVWQDPEKFFDTNNKLIQLSSDYREQIWAPSTREKLTSKK